MKRAVVVLLLLIANAIVARRMTPPVIAHPTATDVREAKKVPICYFAAEPENGV